MHRRLMSALALIACCAAAHATAGDITVNYAFQQPAVRQIDLLGLKYDCVSMPGAPNGGRAGEPALPVAGARILVPYGEEVTAVEVVADEKVLVASGLRLQPVARPFPASAAPTQDNVPRTEPAIYASNAPFPAERFNIVGTFGLRGYQLLILRLQPMEYAAASGDLYYYPQMQVVVHTRSAARVSALFRGLPEDVQLAARKIDNPSVLETYPAARGREERAYDLLIVTTADLADAFLPLKEYHDAEGILTEIHALPPDTFGLQIRNHIRDCYLSDGIQYALIGGDDELLHAPDLWTDDGFGGCLVPDMPSDFYLGCLDGDYSESDPFDLDLVAEVYIGRCPADTPAEVTDFVNKTIAYASRQHTHLNSVLSAAEYLGMGGVSEYGTAMMEQLIDGSSGDGYTTSGIPSATYSIDRLYDSSAYSWPVSEMITRINDGLHIINHCGPGTPTYGLKMGTADVLALTNDDPLFVYSQASHCGQFDGYECLGETFTVKTAHGAFAAIMNARHGWYEFASTDGPNQRFQRQFWDAVFNEAEGKIRLGIAQQDSKEDNLPRLADDCTRYCYYELNLFGDPTLIVYGATNPISIHLEPVPEIITPGTPTDLTVWIDPGYEEYVPGSAYLYYRYADGEFTAVALAPLGGELYQAALGPAPCGSTMEYYFSVSGTVSGVVLLPAAAPAELLSAPVATYVIHLQDDFETDLGWTVWNDPSLTTGAWQRTIPSESSYAGPYMDFDLSGQCYVTDNRVGGPVDYDVDNGPTLLTSPVLDLSQATDPMISYARWMYCDDPSFTPAADYLDVRLSSDGGATWTTVEHIWAEGDWVEHALAVRDFMEPTAQVMIRFSVADNPNNSVTEAAVDAVLVYDLYCPPVNPGDLNCDGAVNTFDIDPFVLALTAPAEYAAQFADCNIMNADTNGDGLVNAFDIDPFVLLLTGG
jgi:hypothetical protein